MAFFDDFADAVKDYPSLSVILSIDNLVVQAPGTVGSVNVNEVWAFKIKVDNNGDLNLTGVSFHVEGQNGATVGTAAAGPFSTSLTYSASLAAVNAHSTQHTVNLYFKAPNAAKAAGTALVRAHISTFDANLDYILSGQSGHADPPAGIYNTQVFP
jgi:hypothetical protein